MVHLNGRIEAKTASNARSAKFLLALSLAFCISGCTLTATPTANGSANVDISGVDPAQVAQLQGQLQGLVGQISGQLPTAPGQVGQFAPLAPATDPNAAGGLPALPPLAPGATAGVTDPNAANLAGTAAVPSGTAAPATTTVPAGTPAAPTTTVAAAPQSNGQNAPNPLVVTAQTISNQFGVAVRGYPDSQALANLNTALALYPSGAARGATINFTGQDAGSLGGTWQTGGLVTLYQTGVHVCAHELAHHIVEQNRAQWGAQLKQYLAYDLGDFPQSAYAVKSAQSGNFEEVAAETVSYYAEGRWKPENPQLEALLKAMITNQPGATAYYAPEALRAASLSA